MVMWSLQAPLASAWKCDSKERAWKLTALEYTQFTFETAVTTKNGESVVSPGLTLTSSEAVPSASVMIDWHSAADEIDILARHFGLSRTALLALPVANWVDARLTDEHMGSVAAFIAGNTHIETISLGRNRISDRGASILAAALPLTDSLCALCISGNRLSDSGSTELAAALPRMGWRTGVGSRLEELRFASNRIGDTGAAALAEAILSLRQLRHLDLRNNSIGDAGAAAIATTLARVSLNELYVQDNHISDAGTAAIAAVLPLTTWMRTLRLSGNRIGNEGACAIAAALPRAPHIIVLGLASNRVGDAGGEALARALPSSKVAHLSLAYNPALTDRTARALAIGVPSSPELITLDLEGHTARRGERAFALALLSAAIFGVGGTPNSARGGAAAAKARPPLALRQLHGVRLVTHVRAIGVLSDELRDELDNGVLLDELRRQYRGGVAAGMDVGHRGDVERMPTGSDSQSQDDDHLPQHKVQPLQPPSPTAVPLQPPEASLVRPLPPPSRGMTAPSMLGRALKFMTPAPAAPPIPAAAPPPAVSPPMPPPPADPATPATEPVTEAAYAPPAAAVPVQPPTGTEDESDTVGSVETPDQAPTEGELQDAIQAVFARWDVDSSGLLSLDEFRSGIVTEVRSPEFHDDPTVRLVYTAAVRAGAQRLFA